MDTMFSQWILVCGCMTALAAYVAVVLRQREERQRHQAPRRAPRETATVALVRRRRELTAQLRDLAGDDVAGLLQSEARRMRATTGSVEVLEAAVARAERQSTRNELPAKA